ncbi:hypothetical protein CI102_9045 [Trichoderma harzianum]|nr:hypothetical protein CI102_9045 [Trichoderma harzianum]
MRFRGGCSVRSRGASGRGNQQTRETACSVEKLTAAWGARLSRAGLLLIRTLARAGSRAEQTGTPFHPDFHIPVVVFTPTLSSLLFYPNSKLFEIGRRSQTCAYSSGRVPTPPRKRVVFLRFFVSSSVLLLAPTPPSNDSAERRSAQLAVGQAGARVQVILEQSPSAAALPPISCTRRHIHDMYWIRRVRRRRTASGAAA